jgi:hypothetical protein
MFVESWQYHPMGWLILGLFVLIALVSILPPLSRHRLMTFMQSRPVLFNALYLAFVVAFLSFGFARALFVLVQITVR